VRAALGSTAGVGEVNLFLIALLFGFLLLLSVLVVFSGVFLFVFWGEVRNLNP